MVTSAGSQAPSKSATKSWIHWLMTLLTTKMIKITQQKKKIPWKKTMLPSKEILLGSEINFVSQSWLDFFFKFSF